MVDSKNIQPVDDRLLVTLKERETVTKSGIVIPETADRDRPQVGEVVAVGPGRLLKTGERAHMSIKKGDTILFSKYGPTEVKIDNQELFFLKEEDVLAVVKSK